ncbi:hypothetical protein ACFE6N_17685 [Pedobacter sp. BG31]|uniref:hypothetical protein n=1 Tax=Pedobacter sp. BG31 TaxID=3349697 RepID=UPI0035F24B18
MAKHNKEINPIKSWIDSDHILASILVEIQGLNKSIEEQAEVAFHRLCEAYSLPKMPVDVDETADSDIEQISVYQELGLVKFLEPNDDLRGLVLVAVYHVLNQITINLDEVYKKAGINKETLICYKGEYSNVKISFLNDNESWFANGCVMCLKGA